MWITRTMSSKASTSRASTFPTAFPVSCCRLWRADAGITSSIYLLRGPDSARAISPSGRHGSPSTPDKNRTLFIFLETPTCVCVCFLLRSEERLELSGESSHLKRQSCGFGFAWRSCTYKPTTSFPACGNHICSPPRHVQQRSVVQICAGCPSVWIHARLFAEVDALLWRTRERHRVLHQLSAVNALDAPVQPSCLSSSAQLPANRRRQEGFCGRRL